MWKLFQFIFLMTAISRLCLLLNKPDKLEGCLMALIMLSQAKLKLFLDCRRNHLIFVKRYIFSLIDSLSSQTDCSLTTPLRPSKTIFFIRTLNRTYVNFSYKLCNFEDSSFSWILFRNMDATLH